MVQKIDSLMTNSLPKQAVQILLALSSLLLLAPPIVQAQRRIPTRGAEQHYQTASAFGIAGVGPGNCRVVAGNKTETKVCCCP